MNGTACEKTIMYKELIKRFETAYIDGSIVSNTTYKPQFVSNNHKIYKILF